MDLEKWLRDQCSQYTFDLLGIYQARGSHAWPVSAADEDELTDVVREGHLLPLPRESAALANVLEVSIVDYLVRRVDETPGLDHGRGSERGYPDLEVHGYAVEDEYWAIDIKVARRKRIKSGVSKNTQSRVTLYTGNTYFRYPKLHWPGTPRPFEHYSGHLDVIGIYTLNVESAARVEDLELIVQPSWKIASKQRSSTTREYIGAVMDIDSLRSGLGEFETPDDFYTYWRKYPFRIGRAVQQQLDKLLSQR